MISSCMCDFSLSSTTTMAFSANEVRVRALPAVFLQPNVSHLKISLNRTFIRELHVDSQRIDISMFFPTHLLLQPPLCQFHLHNSLSSHRLPLHVCGKLAQDMSTTATFIRPLVDHGDHRFNGFFFMADIKMITTGTVAMPSHFPGYQVTDQRTHPTPTTSNMTEINSNNNDDQVMIFDEATSTEQSPSPTMSITRRLQQIDKLKKTEHEVLNAGSENIRDQLGDGGGCCSICLEDFLGDGINKKKNMKLVRFGCTHLYHLTCILQWLDQKDSCPLCRRQLLKPS